MTASGWRNWWGVGMAWVVLFGLSYVAATVYGSFFGTGPMPAWFLWWFFGSALMMLAPLAIAMCVAALNR